MITVMLIFKKKSRPKAARTVNTSRQKLKRFSVHWIKTYTKCHKWFLLYHQRNIN